MTLRWRTAPIVALIRLAISSRRRVRLRVALARVAILAIARAGIGRAIIVIARRAVSVVVCGHVAVALSGRAAPARRIDIVSRGAVVLVPRLLRIFGRRRQLSLLDPWESVLRERRRRRRHQQQAEQRSACEATQQSPCRHGPACGDEKNRCSAPRRRPRRGGHRQ